MRRETLAEAKKEEEEEEKRERTGLDVVVRDAVRMEVFNAGQKT
jgi:hypothetical protein